MLSATPVNNRFSDLKNQLAIAYEGTPELLDNKLNTKKQLMIFSGRLKQLLTPGASSMQKNVLLKGCLAL